jgi:hypothetical protein
MEKSLPPIPAILEKVPVEEIRRELYTRSLYLFAKWAFSVIEPETPFQDNWHIRFLCDHLQAVLSREPGAPQNLLCNVPPGTMKSLIVSVCAPAWMWIRRPSWRAVFTSANERVSLRDSMRCRDLIESEEYQKLFKPGWQLRSDQNAKSQFGTTKGGSRLAITTGQKVTGDRSHALFIDDPHDATQVVSKPLREAVLYWYDNAFHNRVAEPTSSTRVCIMQRLHESDLSAHILAKGTWAHICLPMEYETGGLGAGLTFLGQKDPRTSEGELLFEKRFPPSVLEEERKTMGSAGYAGQHQQRPAAAEGNRFKRDWWRFWKAPGAPDLSGTRPKGSHSAPG